jgi:hypothetical protein
MAGGEGGEDVPKMKGIKSNSKTTSMSGLEELNEREVNSVRRSRCLS